MAADMYEHLDARDEQVLPSKRHGKTEGLSGKLILRLRIYKLMSEIECGKCLPTQLREMITVMTVHNPAVSVQQLWALGVMDKERETGADDGTPFNNIYLLERYILDLLKDNSHLFSR
jgi:hypothetical protein